MSMHRAIGVCTISTWFCAGCTITLNRSVGMSIRLPFLDKEQVCLHSSWSILIPFTPGASSAVLHLISPLSTNLFHKVIAQSGSPLCSWSMESSPENAAQNIARLVGCPSELGNIQLVNCVRKVSFDKLLIAQQHGKIFGEFPHRMLPVIETSGTPHTRLLPADPRILIKQARYRRVPLIMGYNQDETSFQYPCKCTTQLFDPYVNTFSPVILNKNFIGDSKNMKSYLEDKLLPRFIRSSIIESSTFSQSHQSSLIKSARNQIEREIQQNILYKYFNFLNVKNYTDLAYRFVNVC